MKMFEVGDRVRIKKKNIDCSWFKYGTFTIVELKQSKVGFVAFLSPNLWSETDYNESAIHVMNLEQIGGFDTDKFEIFYDSIESR